MSGLKNYLGQKMDKLNFKSKKYTSGTVRMTISELIRLLDLNLLRKPKNQRDMKSSEINKGAKLFFANIMYRLKFATPLPAKISAVLSLKKEVLLPSLGILTLTSIEDEGEIFFHYQDGQHRLAYIRAIVNNEVSLPFTFSAWNEGVNLVLKEVYEAATGLDTLKGIYFSMLPKTIQDQILAMEFDVNIYAVDDEVFKRALYDLQNTTVAMTNNNRQKNLYAGVPIYDLTRELCFALKDKYEICPDWLANAKYKKVRKIVESVKVESLIPLMYRCILATEIDLDYVRKNHVPWDEKSADNLANNLLKHKETVSAEDVEELLTKVCSKIIAANNLIKLDSKDSKGEGGTFGGRLNLLTAAILEVRFLAADKDKVHKESVKKEYASFDTSMALAKKCNEYGKQVSSTYYNPTYTYTTLVDVLRASNKLIAPTAGKEA